MVAKDGNTRPGQSHRIMESEKWIVWKCLVLPGVEATATRLAPTKALRVDDLPTFGYPTNPIVVFVVASGFCVSASSTGSKI